MNILIVGGHGGTNIGDSFLRAALKQDINCRLVDTEYAYKNIRIIRWFNWHFRGRHPSNLVEFSNSILAQCVESNIDFLLSTGIAPISSRVLQALGSLGVQRLNYLTDDPWNKVLFSPGFLAALPNYDVVFSPRRSNIEQLLQAGCCKVEYLPFGYDPELFYPHQPEQQSTKCADIIFAGGADRDRIPYMSTLIQAGFSVDLYGRYWERYPETKIHAKGQADVPLLRWAIQNAKIALCIVRHANRDGHCMRTFEVPAIGTCMLTEDTQEHREIFGPDGTAVVYFKTLTEMVEKARWLINHDTERQRLAQTAHHLITQGGHTYGDRLRTMLHP